MGKKTKSKNTTTLYHLSFGRYNEFFECLNKGEKRNLKDIKSNTNSFIPIEVTDEQVFLTEPDGKLIPNIAGQQKCDFLIYSQNRLQTCFIELKGKNISTKDSYNPYDQISATIDFFKKDSTLNKLTNQTVEKHAFIVSPGRQKLPRGVESKERFLWQKLLQKGVSKKKIEDIVHYVKVTKSDRYSNNGQIICSTKSPVQMPFTNE